MKKHIVEDLNALRSTIASYGKYLADVTCETW